jgi:hypothetical protein
MQTDDKLREAGAAALAKAIALFNLDVWDPPIRDKRPVAERWRDVITDCIGGDGKGNGLAWGWEGRYAGDGDYEWCGALAARCWQEGGLVKQARTDSWSSCYRLQRWASYRAASERVLNAKPSVGPYRLCVALDEHSTRIPDGVEVRPGDILIVGGVGTGPGKHITVIERFDEVRRVFLTREGNGGGIGPDGKRRQGIVRGERPLGLPRGAAEPTYHARWLVRPAPSDLTP